MLRYLKDAPIQRKLLNIILISCAAVIFLMCTAYMIFEYFTFKDTLKSHVATLAAVVASNSTAALAFDTPEDANEVLAAFKEENHIINAALYDVHGNLFAKYPAKIKTTDLPLKSGIAGFWFKGGYLQGFHPVTQLKTKLGMLYIKSDMKGLDTQLRRFGLIAIFLILCSFLLAYFISHTLQKSISKPIIALEKTARAISQERDYSVRAVKFGDDEVGSLTTAFNQMVGRIESQNEEITAFNHNLELKITERTKALEEANESMKQQKDFVETIIDSSIDIIGVFDKEMNYVMVNQKAEEFYHYKREDIIGKNLLSVFPRLESSELVRDLKIALTGKQVVNRKYSSVLINRCFENYYIPLYDPFDKVYGCLTISHDITNIMESHEKLALVNTELLKSNRDLEQFAYIASHDLQEPLRKIQVFTQLLGEHLDNPESMVKYQLKINQSAQRMQELIHDVLNFSRISKKAESFKRTDINLLIENLKNDFELKLLETSAVINYQMMPVIDGIPLQLSQLFSNLISNSLKYTNTQPVIDITFRHLESNEIKNNPRLIDHFTYIQIFFKDNGIGFEPQYKEQIFTIFQRLHGRHSYSGTGIGLALCRKIVENHHGLISATGEPGHGAEFEIILPLEQKITVDI